MLTVAYYFLQVILCSGILLGYYWLVLRNKKFHQYNRFYLLGVGIFSWLVPLIKINVEKPVQQETPQFIHFANIVAGNNSEIENIVVQQGFVVNWNLVVMSLYTGVCSLFLLWIGIGLYRVFNLLKTYSCKSLGDVYLIMTSNVKGTPFSFFKYIFWNDAIDASSSTGQQMMQHELTHVREKHSIDKLFMQLIMVFGWFNPFFWLLKRELHLVHEFIADNKAIKDGDAASLAKMLLTATYPNQQYLFGNPFFFSPIKRRILMLTKTNNPKLSYARRLVVLPLLATVVMLFAFRKKETSIADVRLNKVYTVVVDAGHGGTDKGATATDGTTEKELSLLLLKAIKSANANDKIKLVFTREEDVYQSPVEKAKFVNEQKADLFISLHMNWAETNSKQNAGFEINIPKNDGKRNGVKQSASFAASIEQALVGSFVSNGIKTKEKGIWVLKSTTCPAVLIECGYLSSKNDLALLKDASQRNKMAELIIKGIGNYLHLMETAKLPTEQQWEEAKSTVNNSNADTTEKPTVVVSMNNVQMKVTAQAGEPTKVWQQYNLTADTITYLHSANTKAGLNDALIIVDGTITTWQEVKNLSPNAIQSVTILKDAASIASYGEAARNGVVLITTKKGNIKQATYAFVDEKIVAVNCDKTSSDFIIKTDKQSYKVSFNELHKELDRVETEVVNGRLKKEAYGQLKDVYIKCLAKKEEFELIQFVKAERS